MFLLAPLFVTLLSLSSPSTRRSRRNNRVSNNNKNNNNIKRTSTTQPFSIHDKRLQWANDNDAIFLIDLENVRGKSNFELTHRELLKRTTIWSKANNLQDRISLIVDHGSIHSSYYLPEGGLSVVFAGTRMKADDVLARDISYFDRNAIVITADNDLMSRCRNAMEQADCDIQVQFITPIKFITDLERLIDRVEREQRRLEKDMNVDDAATDSTATTATTAADTQDDYTDNNEGDSHGDSQGDSSPLSQELADKIDEEIKIRGALYETETLMREKKNINTPKKKRKLEKRARQLCERLAMKGGQNIDHLTTLNGITNYDRKFQDEVLCQWEQLRERATRREMTGDRMLLAEHFRRQIENVATEEAKLVVGDEEENENVTNQVDDDHSAKSTQHEKKDSKSYNAFINNLVGSNLATSMSAGVLSADGSNEQFAGVKDTIRLVVISDTHGMEEALTPRGGILPEGDILLHLGDFAIDSSTNRKKAAIRKFDRWLARQPHRTKIVLRGNHDPFGADFPESNANYVSGLKSIAIDGKLTMTLVAYSSPRKLSGSWRKMPVYCDILASHSPPHKIRDTTYHGANAGCIALRNKVERMIAGPPKLWLCGHIHEGRGKEEVALGISQRETMIVNAANANSGRASSIEYGPLVLDFHKEDQSVTIVEGQGIIDCDEVIDASEVVGKESAVVA